MDSVSECQEAHLSSVKEVFDDDPVARGTEDTTHKDIVQCLTRFKQ